MDSAEQLFIPEKIKVGYQNRNDTYSKKLGYVVYYDKKGVLRKEKSWESWRDKKINADDFNNEAVEGFVLNRDVGGVRRSYGWNARVEKVRVYDPRGFEFEISIPNLLFILKECDCSRGKGLEGKFLYAWNRNELVLLPATCEEYKNSMNFTSLQDKNIKGKDLIPGASYLTKKQQLLKFIGRFDYHNFSDVCKKYIFHDGKNFVYYDSLTSFAVQHSDSESSDIAKLQKKYFKSEHGSKIVSLFLKETKPQPHRHFHYEESPGVFIRCSASYDNVYNEKTGGWESTKLFYISKDKVISMENGVLTRKNFTATGSALAPVPDRKEEFEKRYNGGLRYYHPPHREYSTYVEPTNLELFAKLESGTEIQIF